jgi:hypothetical protein
MFPHFLRIGLRVDGSVSSDFMTAIQAVVALGVESPC